MTLLIASHTAPTPVHIVNATTFKALQKTLPKTTAGFLTATGFTGKAGQLALLPGSGERLGGVVFAPGETAGAYDVTELGRLARELPDDAYEIVTLEFDSSGAEPDLSFPALDLSAAALDLSAAALDLSAAALAWEMGGYRFERYKTSERKPARLVIKDAAIRTRAKQLGEAVAFGRTLINTPANDMNPSALAAAALALAKRFKATSRVIVGDKLLKQNFPLIHAVGRASSDVPRLVDFTWGNLKHPKVTLVGKGVCFDTGGLDIKPSSGMALMKKDMGGAAAALTAAQMIMAAKLKVRLRVLVPIVENAIAGNAFRTSDVIKSRKGLTVEIGNTDAEGRLILADALALACEDKPELLIDYATLTGAARVALGADLPPFYTSDETLAADISAAGNACGDPVWRLPLWKAYDRMLDAKIADLSSTGSGGMAGSITAALFLQRFVEPKTSWAHFDIYGWVPATRGARVEGGEPQAARLTFALLEKRYG
jgi:leucyl aminopeptidase